MTDGKEGKEGKEGKDKVKLNHFFVDAKKYETAQTALTERKSRLSQESRRTTSSSSKNKEMIRTKPSAMARR